MTSSASDSVLEVEDLKVHFPVMAGAVLRKQVGTVKAVDGVSFKVRRGETLGLVGESGCGKSTTGLAVLRMLDITSGKVVFEGEDISGHDRGRMRPIRRRLQMVYQDPFGSLNPRMKVSEIVGEPLEVHGQAGDRAAYRERVARLLDMVGLLPDMADRYPHEFSGGQRQRIGIARALALNPELIVGDEPVSALDVSIQAQIINLLMELQDEFKLSYLFVAHDLAVVEHISHRVAVMYLGRIVEMTDKRSLFEMPLHPYTEALLSAVPIPKASARGRKRVILTGDVPSPINPPPGCHFHARCPYAMALCKTDVPALREVMPGHFASCHLHDDGVKVPLGAS
jgi:oligopeptide transport system ATP-binding protein